jgi:sporulation protein YlmC with PRC-barrel domain
MMKKLMLGTALTALMLSGAFAQTPNPSSPPPASKADQAAPAAQAGSVDIVTSQKPDQWLASKFKGTNVVGADNQKIGDVSDILFDKAGKVEAFVISIGGFLGMGAKEVAMAPSSFEVVPGDNGGAAKLKVAMSKDQLKEAQNFTPYEPPRPTTTGSGAPGSRPLGTPGGMRPSSNTPPTGR